MLKHAQAKALPSLISDVYQVSVIGLIYCDDSSSQNTPKSMRLMRQAAKMPSISCKNGRSDYPFCVFQKTLALPSSSSIFHQRHGTCPAVEFSFWYLAGCTPNHVNPALAALVTTLQVGYHVLVKPNTESVKVSEPAN